MTKAVATRAAVVGLRKTKFGRTGLDELLEQVPLEADLSMARNLEEAERLAAEATASGMSFLVAAGGDRLIHAVVNGLMAHLQNEAMVLGIIPPEGGCDFVRNFGLPKSPSDAIRHLRGDGKFRIDVGRATVTRGEGTHTEHFVNVAQAGIGAEIRTGSRLGGLLTFWKAMATFQRVSGTVAMDDRKYQGPILNVVAANTQFYRQGLRIAPKAHPADAMLDVLIMRGSKRDYLETLTKLPRIDHVPAPHIKQFKSRVAVVEADAPLRVEADGEVLGSTPATFEILPGVISLKV